MRKKPSPRLSPGRSPQAVQFSTVADHPSELEFCHFASIPVADLARGHQRNAFMGDDVVEQSLQIFDAMRDTSDVGVTRDCHDQRVRCALKVQPINVTYSAIQYSI